MNRDERRISRRRFLLGASATGAVISGGAGTLAELRDSEALRASLATGSLDLEVSWEGDGTETTLGTVSDAGDGGSRLVEMVMPVESNAAYLWFRTQCPECVPIEDLVWIAFVLETDDGDHPVFEGTLRDARLTLGGGIRLDDVLYPGETWGLRIEWELLESVPGDETITFDFDFYAVQRRHLQNPDTARPPWEVCADCPENGNGGSTEHEISYVAFASNQSVSVGEIDLEIVEDGTSVQYAVASNPVTIEAVALKYATHLDVFDPAPQQGVLAVGDGETFDQGPGNEFAGTDPTRTVPDPLPEYCWSAKYEIDEGQWELIREGCST
jgi:hypothetical protein